MTIYDPYDYTQNQLLDNFTRDNLVQEALVKVLRSVGFDIDSSSQLQISLSKGQRTPQQILADLVSSGSKNQVILLDKDTGKLVLLDPINNIIKQMEALTNTFQNIVLGSTKYTPASGSYSIRGEKDPVTNVFHLIATDSNGVDTKIASIDDITPLQNEIAGIQTTVSSNTADISALKTNTAANQAEITKNTSSIASNASNISSNASSIAANKGSIQQNTANIGLLQGSVQSNQNDINTLKYYTQGACPVRTACNCFEKAISILPESDSHAHSQNATRQ